MYDDDYEECDPLKPIVVGGLFAILAAIAPGLLHMWRERREPEPAMQPADPEDDDRVEQELRAMMRKEIKRAAKKARKGKK